jgi:hypothetical protein
MKKLASCLLILASCMFLSGCGTSEYERRLENSVGNTSKTSKFATDLGPEMTIPGTTVNLCLPAPKIVDPKDPAKLIPNEMKSMDLNDAIRGKCPLLDEFPGLKATYEGYLDDGKGKQCFYLYIGVSDTGAKGLTPLQDWLNGKFQNLPNSSTSVNKNYSTPTPNGPALTWDEIHVTKSHKFFYPTPDKPNNSQDFMGTLCIISRIDNGKMVTLAFRYPDSFKDRHETDFDTDWLKLVAGTVKVGGE